MRFETRRSVLRVLPSSSAYAKILRRFLAAVGDDLVADLRAFVQRAKARLFDRRDVHEHILPTGVRLDETKALGRVEPLHNTCRHVPIPLLSMRRQQNASPPGNATASWGSWRGEQQVLAIAPVGACGSLGHAHLPPGQPRQLPHRFDGVEIGAVSEAREPPRSSRALALGYRHDADDGSRRPAAHRRRREVRRCPCCLQSCVLRWHAGVPADPWKTNREYIEACDRWRNCFEERLNPAILGLMHRSQYGRKLRTNLLRVVLQTQHCYAIHLEAVETFDCTSAC